MTDRKRIRTAPATPDRWPDVVTVMGVRGDPARCWCQYFGLRGRDWDSADAAGFQEVARPYPARPLVRLVPR